MLTPAKDRVAATRYRRRRGLVLIKVTISQQGIEFLAKRGYEAKKDDLASISEAVSMFLADSAMEDLVS